MSKINLSIPEHNVAFLPSETLTRLETNNPSKALFMASALSFAHFYMKQVNQDAVYEMMDSVMSDLANCGSGYRRFRLDSNALDDKVLRFLTTLSSSAKSAFVVVAITLFDSMLRCNLQVQYVSKEPAKAPAPISRPEPVEPEPVEPLPVAISHDDAGVQPPNESTADTLANAAPAAQQVSDDGVSKPAVTGFAIL